MCQLAVCTNDLPAHSCGARSCHTDPRQHTPARRNVCPTRRPSLQPDPQHIESHRGRPESGCSDAPAALWHMPACAASCTEQRVCITSPPPPHTHSLSSSPVHPAAPRSRGAAGATCPFTPAGAAPECLVPQGMARAGLLAQRPQGSNSRGLPAHIRVTLHTHTCTPAVALLRPLSLPAGGTGTTASPTVA